ncbi:RNA polymerase sigma factor [Stieleria varia]|uniref:RNA polymerase sigma factor CnrH n=1 Tax=Stieleria varia TaxID=2528005 RepID=A0A5C6B737_9BACT|nr:sigma-70 family RNA polymerase sigma factor [Stieleria varia]TWU07720.1 RNA polymerase sigma factor CnrH [Stieleria varia]
MSPADHYSEPSTSESLLQRARAGDSDGWHQIASVYGPIVYGWARRCGCQPADAADVMQDTFAAVARSILRFDHDRDGATFRGWLWTIARNKMRDQQRDAHHERATGGTDAMLAMQNIAGDLQVDSLGENLLDATEPPTDPSAEIATAKHRVLQWLRESFDPRTWRMFWESSVLGREVADVADEMKVSKWAVYKARARVLQRLRSEMAGLE